MILTQYLKVSHRDCRSSNGERVSFICKSQNKRYRSRRR